MTDEEFWTASYLAFLSGERPAFTGSDRLAAPGDRASLMALAELADVALKEWKKRWRNP